MDARLSIEKKITNYLPKLNAKQKTTVLTVVKAFMEEQEDWWDKISVEQQNEIDKSLAEMKEGKLTPHAEVMNKYKK
jgi:predicted transcriptional regulator